MHLQIRKKPAALKPLVFFVKKCVYIEIQPKALAMELSKMMMTKIGAT